MARNYDIRPKENIVEKSLTMMRFLQQHIGTTKTTRCNRKESFISSSS
jgi:hypothetical protein